MPKDRFILQSFVVHFIHSSYFLIVLAIADAANYFVLSFNGLGENQNLLLF
jgi:hypothetical protein